MPNRHNPVALCDHKYITWLTSLLLGSWFLWLIRLPLPLATHIIAGALASAEETATHTLPYNMQVANMTTAHIAGGWSPGPSTLFATDLTSQASTYSLEGK